MDTLPKSERLRGKIAVSALMSKGRWGFSRGLKYCYLRKNPPEGVNRIMVSVPETLLQKGGQRNLLKRRLRGRPTGRKRSILGPSSVDILFLYNSKEVNDFQTIKEEVAEILKKWQMKDSYSIPHWRKVVRDVLSAPFLGPYLVLPQVYRSLYSQDLPFRAFMLDLRH